MEDIPHDHLNGFPSHLYTEADLVKIPDGLCVAKFYGNFESV